MGVLETTCILQQKKGTEMKKFDKKIKTEQLKTEMATTCF